jgi:hypothetical protein
MNKNAMIKLVTITKIIMENGLKEAPTAPSVGDNRVTEKLLTLAKILAVTSMVRMGANERPFR